MITGPLRSKVDRLWDEFWTGGVSNPLSVIEQITYLLFLRRLDERETAAARPHARKQSGTPTPYHGLYAATEQHLRWGHFKNLGGEEMLPLVRDKVFPHLRRVGGEFMKDANLLVAKPSLLVTAVRMVDQLPLAGDTAGDLYEYMLGKLTTAGMNGQFRTPRHVIRALVELAYSGAPHRTELQWRVCDPACGTGGFLVAAAEHLTRKYTTPAGVLTDADGQHSHTADDLSPAEREHLTGSMLHGFDFDGTMLRIAAMNLALHGGDPDRPTVHYQDTLSTSFPDRYPNLAADAFDLILANPPFKGSLDAADVEASLTRIAKTRKTELLFLALVLRLLKRGGRAAVIVPDGVLFGSSAAHAGVRKTLVEDHQLEAVVKLPAGVFRPYAGVSTAALLFRKGGRTDHVWFYDVRADGLSLDDKREPVAENDLPDLLAQWAKRNQKRDTDRTAQAFFVSKDDIAAKGYDLSLNRYKVVNHAEAEYDPPAVLLAKLKALEAEIAADVRALGWDAASKTKTHELIELREVIADTKPGFAIGQRDESGVVRLRMNNVDTLGNIDLADAIRVPATPKQVADCSLQPGDVLFNNTNSTELVGKSALFRGHDEPVTFSNHFTRLRVHDERVDPRYLARWLTSLQRARVFEGLCTRWVGQSAVRTDRLLNLKIPLPLLAVQQRLADILDHADAIRRKHLQAADAAGELLAALTQRAFRGQL